MRINEVEILPVTIDERVFTDKELKREDQLKQTIASEPPD